MLLIYYNIQPPWLLYEPVIIDLISAYFVYLAERVLGFSDSA